MGGSPHPSASQRHGIGMTSASQRIGIGIGIGEAL
jgi:hypothetical protein